MLDELRPLGLTDAAKRLGIDPFEVVRLLVVADAMPEQLHLTDDHVEKVRSVGGIEFWWDEVDPPSDADPRRGLVRMALATLQQRGIVGDTTTRLDNLWRGLPAETVALLQQAIGVLVQEGLLGTYPSPRGWQISIQSTRAEDVDKIVEGQGMPPALDAMLTE